MEFKYTKGSKTLEDLSQQYIEQENTRCLKAKEQKYARMEKEGYLHSAQELIDYVLGGGCIVEYHFDDWYDTYSEWMKLIDGKIVHHQMFYNDVDSPIGLGKTTMTIDEFKDWANLCEKHQKESGSPFVNEYLHKDLGEDEMQV